MRLPLGISLCSFFLIFPSVCTVEFVETSSELFLAVGIVKDMTFQPMVASEYSINIYRFVSENRGIELVHKV